MEDRRASSRYAKACRECATTKAKCIRYAHALKCERCARLNKECKARVAASRAPRAPKPNRLTQMEEKLDGLVTLLVATQPQGQPSVASNTAPLLTPNSLSPDAPNSLPSPIQLPFVRTVPLQEKTKKGFYSEEQSCFQGENAAGHSNTWPKCHSIPGDYPIHSLNLSNEAAEALLENYQTSMAKYFPFVVIPSKTTAQDLRASKPFLFLSVMVVSSYQKMGQQSSLSMKIMRQLSDQMLFEGEKSIDLLQGLLVYIEWYQSHRLTDGQLTNILHLSCALLVDLGLNKAPYICDAQNQTFPDSTELVHGKMLARTRSNDERRVFLGCFYLTSAMSSCFKKADAMRYTAHVEESCNALAQNPEYESDEYLVQLVKLQHIAERITQSLPYDFPPSIWPYGTPIKLLVDAFHRELQAFQASLPQSLQEDILMQSHIQNTEIHLFEISLTDWSRQPPSSSFNQPHPPNPNTPLQRLSTLHQTLLSTSALLTTFLTQPTTHDYASFPFVVWAQSVHAMQVLSKLSLLPDVPGWDLAAVQTVLDFPTYLDSLCERLDENRVIEEDLQRSYGAEVVGSRFEMYRGRLLRVRAWFDLKLRSNQIMLLRGQQQELQNCGIVGVGAEMVVASQDGDLESDMYGVVGGPATPAGPPRRMGDVGVGGVGGGGGTGALGGNGGSGGGGNSGIDSLRGDEFFTQEMLEQMDDAYWHDFLAEWASL